MSKNIRSLAIVLSLILVLFILMYGLGSALLPLLFSFALAYMFFPLIVKLERKGLPRTGAVIGVFIILTIVLAGALTLLLPKIVSDATGFVKELPTNAERAITRIESFSSYLGYEVHFSKDSLKTFFVDQLKTTSGTLLKNASKGFKGFFGGALQGVLALLNLFLIPLFFFYVINDFENIKKSIRSFIPKSILPKLKKYLNLTNDVLSGYIRGQLIVALILAGLYATGLSIVGLRFGFLIGLLSGLISIIPYAGFSIGFATALMIGLANNAEPSTLIGIIFVFVLVQALEGMIITPKLVGDKVGLSALVTMLSLIIGGNLFGFTGMLLAIPMAAVLKSLLSELKAEYQQLSLYKSS